MSKRYREHDDRSLEPEAKRRYGYEEDRERETGRETGPYSSGPSSYSRGRSPPPHRSSHGSHGRRRSRSRSRSRSPSYPLKFRGFEYSELMRGPLLTVGKFREEMERIYGENLEKGGEKTRERYEEYKEKYRSCLRVKFLSDFKSSSWFLEKYHPLHSSNRSQLSCTAARSSLYVSSPGPFPSLASSSLKASHVSISIPFQSLFDFFSLEDHQVVEIREDDPEGDLYEMPKRRERSKNVSLTRNLWITYPSPALALSALSLLAPKLERKRKEFGEMEITMAPPGSMKGEEKENKKEKEETVTAQRLLFDLKQAELLCLLLDSKASIAPHSIIEPLPSSTVTASTSPEEVGEKVDRITEYMREVHFLCYFCGRLFPSRVALISSCGNSHPRPPLSSLSSSQDQEWADELDSKIKDIMAKLNALSSDPSAAFQSLLEEKRVAICKSLYVDISTADKTKLRCSVESCKKKFETEPFIINHFKRRHPEIVESHLNKWMEEEMINNYLEDLNAVQYKEIVNISDNKGQSQSQGHSPYHSHSMGHQVHNQPGHSSHQSQYYSSPYHQRDNRDSYSPRDSLRDSYNQFPPSSRDFSPHSSFRGRPFSHRY